MRITTLKRHGLKSTSGFSLVIALSLMAFVLLLLLSITSFVAVEQNNVEISKQQLSARQNALAGLQVAIGELQVCLGPDQRATASADILEKDNNPYTLVWHSDPAKVWDSTTLDWKDGGDSPDFALPLISVDPSKLGSLIAANGAFDESQLGNDAVELITITNPGNGSLTALKGERRPLTDSNGAVAGHYAWVAQDESLKANLKTEHGGYNATDADGNIIDKNHRLALVETSRRLSVFPYANAAGVTIESQKPFSSVDPVNGGSSNSDYFDRLEKASSLSDLISSGILTPATTSGTTAQQLAPYRNHFTLCSKGVLADAKNGGLRRDLSRGLDDQYFEKLHGVPVFGVDRDGNVIADGINDPVGDQWKYFRDYYNFYRPVDEGLVDDLNDQNIFYGLDDITAIAPSIRMRFTDVNKDINHIYNSPDGTNPNDRSYNVSYAGPVTPSTVHANERVRDIGNSNLTITDQSWYIYTPELRPVFLRKSIKIGIQTRQTTSADFADPNHPNLGKYILQFKVYPSMILWNPFNVTIDMDPTENGSSLSNNPLANGELIQFVNVSGGIRFPIDITSGGNTESYTFDIRTISPRLRVVSNKAFEAMGIPKKIGPGEVIIFGLRDSYLMDLYDWTNPNNGSRQIKIDATTLRRTSGSLIDRDMSKEGWEAGAGNWGSVFHLFPAASGYGVSEDNGLIYESRYLLNGNTPEEVYMEGNDTIIIRKSSRTVSAGDEYSWSGKISGRDSKSTSPERGFFTNLFESFHQATNSDLIYIDEDVSLGAAAGLTNADSFPFYQIDFRGRTLSDEEGPLSSYGNPAVPAFANVNYLGTMPLGLKGAGYDTWQDVKALYIPERLSINIPLDPFSERDATSGAGYYGSSFDNNSTSSSRITLYDIPRHPIVSTADFKNLVFSWFEDAPARPIGASWPNATLANLSDTYIKSHEDGNDYSIGAGCDTSYYYNDTLFDSYFFSGIPSEERDNNSSLLTQTFPYGQTFNQSYINDQKPLANTRLSYYGTPELGDLRDPAEEVSRNAANGFKKTAAYIMIDAPFNINSTSAKAWQAILSGFRSQNVTGVDKDYRSKINYTDTGSPFVDNFIPSGSHDDLYAGHRRLGDNQIADLSAKFIDEIRDRGISRSLGNFLNRSKDSTESDEQRMSRIDKAILEAGLNASLHISNSTTHDKDLIARPNERTDQAHMFAKSLAPETGAGLPGYLKQQDILRALSPIMTTRGDTFTVRSYGESIDPLSGAVNGKAWCEAVIQRVPDYLEDSTEAWDFPMPNSNNEKFGRKFVVIRFRWLSEDDIS